MWMLFYLNIYILTYKVVALHAYSKINDGTTSDILLKPANGKSWNCWNEHQCINKNLKKYLTFM
jgi:hypothetical protein